MKAKEDQEKEKKTIKERNGRRKFSGQKTRGEKERLFHFIMFCQTDALCGQGHSLNFQTQLIVVEEAQKAGKGAGRGCIVSGGPGRRGQRKGFDEAVWPWTQMHHPPSSPGGLGEL